MSNPQALLDAAEKVAEVLDNHHLSALVIGAVALAAHHYVRYTHDIDLGVNASVETLRKIEMDLQNMGFTTVLREPDGQDPLGGVIDIKGDFGLLQIISFANRFPAAIEDALHADVNLLRQGSRLKLAPLPQLIALKLYAGGLKSKLDVLELLQINALHDNHQAGKSIG